MKHYIIWLGFSLFFLFYGIKSGYGSVISEPEIITQNEIPLNIFNRYCRIAPNEQDESDSTAVLKPETNSLAESSTVPVLQPDLWDILGSAFTIPVPNDSRVEYYKDWYLSNPYHLDVVSARAEPFLFYIYQQVKQRKMPIELVLLPLIESSFDQFAYSERGASGLWQFTVATGKAFGLEYLKGYDGRRDIAASTSAALDLLDYLYKKFDGNWLHALAAYNTGEGRVRKAIKENLSNGKPTDFWSLTLPKETRLYVPKLLAMADLVKHRNKHSLKLAYIKAEAVLSEVVIKHKVNLQRIARLAELTKEELYGLNPGYTSGYTFHNRQNTILLPKSNRIIYDGKNHSVEILNDEFTIHHIQPGDSLSEIAYLNNTTVSNLQKANNLSGTTIFAGQPLLIPVN